MTISNDLTKGYIFIGCRYEDNLLSQNNLANLVGLIERPVQIGGLQPTFLLLRDFKDAAAIDAFGTLEFKLIPVDPTRKSDKNNLNSKLG